MTAGRTARRASRASAEQELSPYAARVLEELRARFPWEHEFLQAAEEVLTSVSVVLETEPRFRHARILERMVEPEQVHAFRVVWTNDRNEVEVNRGWRVQFNSTLGPYKGGLRFHRQVSLGGLKFLAFEQTFKNSLTGLPLGSGKGGADFEFRGRSEHEMMRFCQAFMQGLYRYIGPDLDVPAGDIGVGAREIGYLFGQYRRLKGGFPGGSITGKGVGWGGSLLRPEATGAGLAYLTDEVLRARGSSLEGKRVAVSGFGNVAWGTVGKVTELGGKVVTLSGPDGFVHDPDGVREEKHAYLLELRASGLDTVAPYAERFGADFYPGKRPWCVPCDVALPCAIQNELDETDARDLVASGCQYVLEGANMPTTAAAVGVLQEAGVVYVPGKAANAGGVAVSGFEMQQNAQGTRWTGDEVDAALRRVMCHIHDACREAAAQWDRPDDYLFGANVAGFLRVAEAMMEQGAV